MAWVVRHFVAHVVEHPKDFWASLLSTRKLEHYMTSSDLAFAVLLLEHHMMKWRHLIQSIHETGVEPSEDYKANAPSLLCQGGIAGEEAKWRFDDLNLYFHRHFYSPVVTSDRDPNMKRLQEHVGRLVEADRGAIEVEMAATRATKCGGSIKDLQNDILHRVFYCMNS